MKKAIKLTRSLPSVEAFTDEEVSEEVCGGPEEKKGMTNKRQDRRGKSGEHSLSLSVGGRPVNVRRRLAEKKVKGR